MIVIDDEHFKFLVISILLSRLEHGDVMALREAGLEDRQMEELRRMSASDLTRLCSLKLLKIAVRIDGPNLDRAIDLIKELREEMELIEWFIHRNAPTSMMEELFDMAPEVVERMRSVICDCVRPGRPSLPPPETRDRIHLAWHEIKSSGVDEQNAYRTLGLSFPEYDMHSLYAVIKEFED